MLASGRSPLGARLLALASWRSRGKPREAEGSREPFIYRKLCDLSRGGFTPFIINFLGRRQAVSHKTLDLAFPGSNPGAPVGSRLTVHRPPHKSSLKVWSFEFKKLPNPKSRNSITLGNFKYSLWTKKSNSLPAIRISH